MSSSTNRYLAIPSKAALHFDSRAKQDSSDSSQRVRRPSKFFQLFRSPQKLEEVSVAELSVQDLRHVPRFHEPLQYNRHEVLVREERRKSLSRTYSPTCVLDECTKAPGKSSRMMQVTFREDVVVVPVPLRSDYSERLRTKLWSNTEEMCENIGKQT